MIPVRNVYYMLSYAFRVLTNQGYKGMETEEFHNVAELCAAILCRGVSIQLKRGLVKEYIPKVEPLSSPKGKIDVSDSIKDLTITKRQLVCSHDEFTINCYMNRIIKTTLELLASANINTSRKKDIRRMLLYFKEVDSLDIYRIDWSMQFNRNNQNYRMLINVCWLVIKGLIHTNQEGSVKLMDYLDDQKMHRLYEKFILEYYRTEHTELRAEASQIPWNEANNLMDMLPIMQTDVTLTKGNKTLVIDAKYYSKSVKEHFNRTEVISGNMYQIFTYVKNKTDQLQVDPRNVAGLLLYAKTDEQITPDNDYEIGGNTIGVHTLDLNADFDSIRKELDAIVEKYL
ncbi:MAG: 5-methylcytosine-specific restriction endonuclease system specificity protein McrC [Lachnospiraceae bacterium]|nr:5-methylcytosine-specific restriction endonuclease system specificity protein McrC [Lachnospiraceae bacterium]